jgi:RNA polymerase sigma-70 factor (ECF subfamily)
MNLIRDPQAADSTEISGEEISVLVRHAQSGNPEAFEQLLRILQPRLHRQAFFLTGDEHQALDLMQETVLEAWKHLGRYDGRARFFTWLCGLMLHRHYDWLRRIRTRAFVLLGIGDFHDESEDESAPGPSQGIEEAERARLMKQCLDELPAPQREAVYLRFYADESIEGIAVIARCSPGTVKSRLFHALRRLAKMQKLKELQNREGEHQ